MAQLEGILRARAVDTDRIPDEMKKFALGAIEDGLAKGKENPLPNETPKIKTTKNQFIDSIADGVKEVLFEGEAITLGPCLVAHRRWTMPPTGRAPRVISPPRDLKRLDFCSPFRPSSLDRLERRTVLL